MKKVCFLIGHEQSGSNILFDILSANPRIQGYKTLTTYNHPLSLESLTNLPHKLRNTAAIWLTELLHNYQFSCKKLYNICKFIYMIRPAEATLNGLVDVYDAECAAMYYCYRLQRICEMAKRTPGAVLVTDMSALPLIEEYLGLKEHLLPPELENVPTKNLVKWEIVQKCQESYERHLFFLRSQNLSFNC